MRGAAATCVRAAVALVSAVATAVVLTVSPSFAAADAAYSEDDCGEVVDGELIVCVREESYEPDGTSDAPAVVDAGTLIRWVWLDSGLLDGALEHTVTAETDRDGEVAFDSDDRCDDDPGCRSSGNTFRWKAEGSGTIDYFCQAARASVARPEMTASLTVRPPPSPTPSPSPRTSPGVSPTPTTTSSSPGPTSPPTDGVDPSPYEPRPRGSASDGDAGGDAGSDGSAGLAARTAAPREAVRAGAMELSWDLGADGTTAVAQPDVAAPEATFSPFPSPEPLAGAATEDELGAIDVPGGSSGLTRGRLIGVAFASLVFTVGAFAKIVLLGGEFG